MRFEGRDRDSVEFFGHVSQRFLGRGAILVGRLAGKLGSDGNTRGTGARRGATLTCPASCWPPRPRRRLSCARRTGISKHPIVLSVFRSRVCHLFFPGHLSRRSSGSFGTTGITRPSPSLPPTTTSELQRSCLSLTANRMVGITVRTHRRQVRQPNGDV